MTRYEEIKNLTTEELAERLFNIYVKGYLDGISKGKMITVNSIIEELKGEI